MTPAWQKPVLVGSAVALVAAVAGLGFLFAKAAVGHAGASIPGAAATEAGADRAATGRAPGQPGARSGAGAARVFPGRVAVGSEMASASATRVSGQAHAAGDPGSAGSTSIPVNPAAQARAAEVLASLPTPAREALADLRSAIAANDFDKVAYAEARLRSFLAAQAEHGPAALLDLFKGETDPAVLAVLAGVLASDGAATASKEIAASMAAVAEDTSAPEAQREQALAFLAQSSAADGDLDRRLAALAGSGDAGWRQAALAALASRAAAAPADRAAELAPLLLKAIVADPDPEIRSTFLAAVPLHDAPAATVAEVAAVLRDDASTAVREAAAHALGDAPPSARASAAADLEQAFQKDVDRGARRAILASLVRLLGPGALAPVERVRPAAGTAQPDCDDYIEILRSGETQADRVFELKFAREVAREGPVTGSHEHRE